MTAVYGENAAGTLSLAELEVLDAKLVRAKEVDDFYVEFLEGAMDKHIEFLDGMTASFLLLCLIIQTCF